MTVSRPTASTPSPLPLAFAEPCPLTPQMPSFSLARRLELLPSRSAKEIVVQKDDPEMAFIQRYFHSQQLPELAIKRVIYYGADSWGFHHKWLKKWADEGSKRKPDPGLKNPGLKTSLLWCCTKEFREAYTDSVRHALTVRPGPLSLDWVMHAPDAPLNFLMPDHNALSTFKVELEPRDTTGAADEEELSSTGDLHDFEAVLVNVRASAPALFITDIATHIAAYALSPYADFFSAIDRQDMMAVDRYCRYHHFIEMRDAHLGETPLLRAICLNALAVIAVLEQSGANICAITRERVNALHLAARYKHEKLVESLIAQYPPFLKAKDKHGRTPLHVAAEKGLRDSCEKMIAKGADPRAVDNYGWNVLHFAAKGDQSNVINYFLDVEELEDLLGARTKAGSTPIAVALEYNHPVAVATLKT